MARKDLTKMMKFCSSNVARIIVNASKGGYQNDAIAISMLRDASFSTSINHNPKNINSNKVDAPFAKTETKVSRGVISNDLDNEPFSKNKEESRSMTDETAGYMADKAKKGTKSAVETAFEVGEKMAEGMQQTLGTIKDTTQKVKDTIVGNCDDNGETSNGGREKVDKHVEDLRNKAGGYDRRTH